MLFKIALSLVLITVSVLAELESLNSSAANEFDVGESRILSRRKRFLIFPDGSSFQLVFEMQNHGYLQIGNVVWFGNTAALAWELPSDPSAFSPIKSELRDPLLRRQDVSKHILFLDEVGKVIAKVPYRKKPIVSPVFGKRSIQNEDENITIKKQVLKKMHKSQKSRSYLHNLDEASAHFHRVGRHSLYKKLETLFEALGYSGRECMLKMLCEAGQATAGQGIILEDIFRTTFFKKEMLGYSGRECILRMLCEAGRATPRQGTFLEEIFRATFTLPKGAAYEDLEEYDKAHNTATDCALMYPECDDLQQQR